LKLRFRFSEKDVIIHQRSLIIFDGMIGNERDVSVKKITQSTMAQSVDNIRYRKACNTSFLPCCLICAFRDSFNWCLSSLVNLIFILLFNYSFRSVVISVSLGKISLQCNPSSVISIMKFI
jgi:hypothetical protein